MIGHLFNGDPGESVTSYVDRVPVDQISAQARQVDFGRAALAAFAALFILIGKVIGLVVNAAAWIFVAVRLGYREVRPPRTDAGGR
jgi:hypothetical protein